MFYEIQFPAPISLGADGGPKFDTEIIKGDIDSDNVEPEVRQNNGNGAWEWTIKISSIRISDLDQFIAFQMIVKGKESGFRFKNWLDYKITGGNIGTGDGETTVFQVIKTYTVGSYSATKIIKKIVSGTLVAYVDGVETSVTVNYNTGQITFATAPVIGAVITIDCEFDYMARFAEDYNPVKLKTYSAIEAQNIKIIEINE